MIFCQVSGPMEEPDTGTDRKLCVCVCPSSHTPQPGSAGLCSSQHHPTGYFHPPYLNFSASSGGVGGGGRGGKRTGEDGRREGTEGARGGEAKSKNRTVIDPALTRSREKEKTESNITNGAHQGCAINHF